MKEDVSVILRTRTTTAGKKVKTWAYCLRDSDTGRFSKTHFSVLSLAKKLQIAGEYRFRDMNRTDANRIVGLALEKGLIAEQTNRNRDCLLIPYVTKIWTYDSSPWVADQNGRKTSPLTKAYVRKNLRAFELHAAPFIKEKTMMTDFRLVDAMTLQRNMYSAGVSADNLNDAMQALSRAYQYAVRQGIVAFNPMNGVEPYQSKTTEPIPLTRHEANELLKKMEAEAPKSLLSMTCFLATKLAIYGGLREGEIRVLKRESITPLLINDQPTDYYKISITSTWDEIDKKIGPTKGKYKRTTCIHKSLAVQLIENANRNPHGNNLVFYTPLSPSNPVSKNALQEHLYDALETIGIMREGERKKRKLTFQTLRHFFSTEMKLQARKTDELNAQIRKAIGHKSIRVDEDIYTHVTNEQLLTVGILSEHLLDVGLLKENKGKSNGEKNE